MRRIDLFCPSVASTEICLSTRDESCGGGGRAIDRHNPHLRDNRRRTNTTTADPSSSSSSSQSQPHKKSSKSKNKSKISFCANRCDRTISPSGSSRYLLSDDTSTTLVDHEFAPVLPTQSSKSCIPHPNSSSLLSSTTPPPATNHDHQVVALRVSLHCRGCEGKVRKHLSKMKGVTSFNIDFGMKKVTVIGDVTPVGVLASISRVKNAQFWPSLSSSSSIHSNQRISKSII